MRVWSQCGGEGGPWPGRGAPGRGGGLLAAEGGFWPASGTALLHSSLHYKDNNKNSCSPHTHAGETWWRACFSWKRLLWFPWLWWSHTVVRLDLLVRVNITDHAVGATLNERLSFHQPLLLGSVAEAQSRWEETLIPASSDILIPLRRFSDTSTCPHFRAARYREMWQWDALRVWRRRRQNYLQLPLRWKDDDGRG